ncbi:hypothetical protein TPA0907_23010 [Micromonospora humidisoli]|uniref:hypothetical protein n=1 Tax=Micromonospora sp. AKA109 TaxID=2733865 RepID=UPI0022BE945A|nr:hypothetical protein [Micromonospora sp. AKA109]GHJ07934.1 hypothetical protein TPA0907_23010 [Micromonospora sp. AKA109]
MTTAFGARQMAGPSTDLHYYLVHDGAGGPEGLLVEEFLLAVDHSCVGLVSAGWHRAQGRWSDASATSRRVRVDPALWARVTPAGRAGAATLYRSLCGAGLPGETALRACFGVPCVPPSPPLLLHRPEATPGFRETRVYRILFVGALPPGGLAALGERWRMPVTGDLGEPGVRVLGTVRRRVGRDAFRWELRRVAAGAAWGLDMTCDLAGGRDEAVGVLLRGLTTQVRQQGLIPVTVDRFR